MKLLPSLVNNWSSTKIDSLRDWEIERWRDPYHADYGVCKTCLLVARVHTLAASHDSFLIQFQDSSAFSVYYIDYVKSEAVFAASWQFILLLTICNWQLNKCLRLSMWQTGIGCFWLPNSLHLIYYQLRLTHAQLLGQQPTIWAGTFFALLTDLVISCRVN